MTVQQGSSYKDLFYQSEDGLTLYARDYPAPSPDARCVLLMHGLSRNSRDFEVLAERLSKRYRVLVAEQRGRGKSEWDTDPTRYAIPHYVRDMFALLQAANVSRVATVGTSMGGLMAMVMNSAMPGVFSHVVLNDIGPELCDEGLNRIKGYVGQGEPVTTWLRQWPTTDESTRWRSRPCQMRAGSSSRDRSSRRSTVCPSWTMTRGSLRR